MPGSNTEEQAILAWTEENGNDNGPFALEQVDAAIEADDCPTQDEVLPYLYSSGHGIVEAQLAFNREQVKTIKLSTLKTIHDHKSSNVAIGVLKARREIIIDEEYQYKHDDPDLAWIVNEYYLDYLLIIGASIGLDAIIPNRLHDHNFVFHLCLGRQKKIFSANYGCLGFDPTGKLQYIGQVGMSAVWLGMVPIEADPVHDERILDGRPVKWMSTKHHAYLTMFMAKALNDMAYQGVVCHDTYPDVTNPLAYQFASNVFSRDIWELRLQDLKEFDRMIKNNYRQWVDSAPESYKSDRFLVDHIPIAICCRYGQNQRIGQLDTLRAEARDWSMERDYSKMRYVSLAVATHLECRRVKRWRDLTTDEITEKHPVVYDSPYEGIRNKVIDLNALPLVGEDDHEVTVYDDDGYRVARRNAIFSASERAAPMLIDLRRLEGMFAIEDRFDEGTFDLDNPTGMVPFSAYPQAFLKNVGNVRAKGLLPSFEKHLEAVNATVGLRDPDEEVDLQDNAMESTYARPVKGIALQIYNQLSHRARSTVPLHDAQRGQVTAALSGTHATNNSMQAKMRKEIRNCDYDLPHKLFQKKIDNPRVPTALRLENVFVIKIADLAPTARKGSALFMNIVYPLARAWAHPTVLPQIKNNVKIFRPHIFPEVYNITTYPITSALEKLWSIERQTLGNEPNEVGNNGIPPKPTKPYVIELCAVLERALNYGHTGNVKVLATSLMNPLWVSRALLANGFPAVNSHIVDIGSTEKSIYISVKDWPVHPVQKNPYVASKATQIYYYDSHFYEAYYANFHMSHCLHVVPTSPRVKNSPTPHSLVVAEIACIQFIQEVKVLVMTGVRKDVNSILQNNAGNPMVATRQQSRLTALKVWSEMDSPLSLGSGFENLLLAVSRTNDDMVKSQMMSQLGDITSLEFVNSLVRESQKDTPQTYTAPMLSAGSAFMSIRAATEWIQKLCDEEAPEIQAKQVEATFIAVVHRLKIEIIPWSPDRQEQTGRPLRKPVYNTWRFVGMKRGGNPTIPPSLNGNEMALAARLSKEKNEMDWSAEWSMQRIHINKICDIYKKHRPPNEFHMNGASLGSTDDYVRQTYVWAMSNATMADPIHQLAFVAAYVFAKLLPRVFVTKDHLKEANNLSKGSTAHEITARVRHLPWTASESETRKGAKAESRFFAMWPTYIIALYDSSSPLREHVDPPNTGGFGILWTKKHGNKGISPINLVRMGLGTAKSSKIFFSPMWQMSFDILPRNDILDWAKQVKDAACNDNIYGSYDCIALLVGHEQARRLAIHGLVVRPSANFKHMMEQEDELSTRSVRRRLDSEL